MGSNHRAAKRERVRPETKLDANNIDEDYHLLFVGAGGVVFGGSGVAPRPATPFQSLEDRCSAEQGARNVGSFRKLLLTIFFQGSADVGAVVPDNAGIQPDCRNDFEPGPFPDRVWSMS